MVTLNIVVRCFSKRNRPDFRHRRKAPLPPPEAGEKCPPSDWVLPPHHLNGTTASILAYSRTRALCKTRQGGSPPAMRIPRRSLVLQLFVSLALLCATAASQNKDKEKNKEKDKAATAANTQPYRNPALATDDRVADLLSRMTLEEKVGQITGGGEDKVSVIDPTGTFTDESARVITGRWWD